MSDSTVTIVPKQTLVDLLALVREAQAPMIRWNESPVIIQRRTEQARRDHLDNIEDILRDLLQ